MHNKVPINSGLQVLLRIYACLCRQAILARYSSMHITKRERGERNTGHSRQPDQQANRRSSAASSLSGDAYSHVLPRPQDKAEPGSSWANLSRNQYKQESKGEAATLSLTAITGPHQQQSRLEMWATGHEQQQTLGAKTRTSVGYHIHLSI